MTAMYIDSTGTGPDLVLIHGWALHGGIFAPLVADLAHEFRLHRVDLPGHGYSHTAGSSLDPTECVETIGKRIPNAIWLGWSMGGLFALHAALTTRYVRGLIMAASVPRFTRDEDWPDALPDASIDRFLNAAITDYPLMLRQFLALDLANSPLSTIDSRTFYSTLLKRAPPRPEILHAGRDLLLNTDYRYALTQLNIPTLWLSGRRDRIVFPTAMRSSAERTPDAAFAEISHGGHAPFLSEPETVVQHIRHFARSHRWL